MSDSHNDGSTPLDVASSTTSSIRVKRGVELWLDGDIEGDGAIGPVCPSTPRDRTSPTAVKSLSALDIPSPPPPLLSMDDQLRLLKEKRRVRSGAVEAVLTPRSSLGDLTTRKKTTAPPLTQVVSSSPSSASKPPLSARLQQQMVHVPRRQVPTDSGAAGSTPLAELNKALSDIALGEECDWHRRVAAFDLVRRTLDASAGPSDPTVVRLRQELHSLVTGTLTAMDSPRSAVSKAATDSIGAVARKLSSCGAAGGGTESNTVDHFVDAIIQKLVSRGGSVSSRFLFDSAVVGLKELVLGTKCPRALTALVAINPLPKVDKGRILWGMGLMYGVENAPVGALSNKGTGLLSSLVRAAETLTSDTSGEVRETGKLLAGCIGQYTTESHDDLQALVRRCLSDTKAARLIVLCAGPPSTGTSTVSPVATPSTGRRSKKTVTQTAAETAVQPSKPAPGAAPRTGVSPNSEAVALVSNDSFTAASVATVESASSVTPRDTSLSPRRVQSLLGSGAAPRPISTATDASWTSPMDATLARDMRAQEHGPYGHPLFLAAEGATSDRVKAVEAIATLLRKHLQDPATAGSPIEPLETCMALCDVVALRCADTSSRVQAAALELLMPLFRCVAPTVVDSTASRWVSCLSTALGSSYPAIRTAAVAGLSALLIRVSNAGLGNLFQTMCVTAATVRNANTKTQLLGGLVSLLLRHHHLASTTSSSIGATSTAAAITSNNNSVGLRPADVEFCLETALRVWASDERADIRTANAALLRAIAEHASDQCDVGRGLDASRLDPAAKDTIRQLLSGSCV